MFTLILYLQEPTQKICGVGEHNGDFPQKSKFLLENLRDSPTVFDEYRKRAVWEAPTGAPAPPAFASFYQ